MKTALVLIDIQNDYFPNGKMELNKPLEAVQHAKQVLDSFRDKKRPIIHVQHISAKENATFFLPNTEGAEIHQKVKPLEKEYLIKKHFPNSFRDTNLLRILQKESIDTLVICGMMTHMCIDATVRAANDLEFRCIVIENACTTKDLEFQENTIPAQQVHQSFISALNNVYAEITTANDLTQIINI
ncbi:cysteine hydrolase family protein [Bacillus sp. TL12]|uniref:cysteine hydrolase family protein n=1 Tax=Bacillus sp. TL12 TaxID=2894756 RepID=UPI001F521062|nr:cysteine hydrolase family protein [Bacillus sp. TL12]MCI0768474.1 cysteine hydrolase [Bacillus sp. TL12]